MIVKGIEQYGIGIGACYLVFGECHIAIATLQLRIHHTGAGVVSTERKIRTLIRSVSVDVEQHIVTVIALAVYRAAYTAALVTYKHRQLVGRVCTGRAKYR